MKYVELTRFGIPWEVCRMVEGPALGSPGPGQVNIKVEAGPINPTELLLIEGKYASRPPLPARLGICLLYTSPSPRDKRQSRMPSSA